MNKEVDTKQFDSMPVIDMDKMVAENASALAAQAESKIAKISDTGAISKYKKLEISQDMYEQASKLGMNLTEYLETQDPSWQYKPIRTNKGELVPDAFERQLIVRGLSIHGRSAASLDAFYHNASTNRVLFPEFISRNIRIGQRMSRLDVRTADLIMGEIGIDAGVYRSVDVSEVSGDDASLKSIAEGAAFPAVQLTETDVSVNLKKYGRKIKASYEYLRRVKVPIIALTLQYIGMRIEKNEVADAIDVLINGNTGNSNAAGNTNSAASGTLAFADLVQLFLDMGSDTNGAFDMRKLIMNRVNAKKVLAMAEFTDNAAGNTFAQTGEFYSPLGATIKLSESLSNDILLGVDERFALIRVNENGSQLTETDRIIDGQWQEIIISEVLAFVKNFADAARTLDYVWP